MSVILGENGGLPSNALTSGHLTLTEDGDTLATEVYDCQISMMADVVILLDHSTSMLGTIGNNRNIHEKFFSSIGTFIGQLPFGSRYALLPYTDSVTADYPQQQTSEQYYREESWQDSIDCINAIRSLVFYGNTNVDAAIPDAMKKLNASSAPKKIIVLITDDFTLVPDSIGQELFRAGIKLFVLETGKDNAPTNFTLARKTGGTYYQAGDTSLYSFYLKRIAEHIKAEHCMIRYTTNKKCPWNTSHTVAVTLDYNTTHKTNWHGYITPHAPADIIPPALSILSPTFTSREIKASEDYPCERGLESFSYSMLTNFTKYTLVNAYPNKAADSLEVIDPLLPAQAVYIAKDSAGNETRKTVYYFPIDDTSSIQPLVFTSDMIDFGRKEAPIDTSISIKLINPNSKPVTVNSVSATGDTKEITTTLSAMSFDPYEEKNVDVRFASSLLGNYSASYTLKDDDLSLGTLKTIGSTYGRIDVWIDTSTVTAFGDTGSVLLRFRAKPAPINLDSLIVTLDYDSDLIDFITGRIQLPPNSPLSSYTMSAATQPGGKLELKFTRSPTSLPVTIDSADAYIILPLRTYLARNSVSVISVNSYIASFGSLLSSTQGLLSVTDGCGDSLMRAYLNDKNSLRITGISMKDRSQMVINYHSLSDDNTKIIITDILGRVVYSEDIHSKSGLNSYTIDKSIGAGSYILSIQNHSAVCTKSFAIIR
ncbi:MAG TPA: VWA domain-containing protein [Candidatus Kapabacteria bacterium]